MKRTLFIQKMLSTQYYVCEIENKKLILRKNFNYMCRICNKVWKVQTFFTGSKAGL